MCIVYIGGRGDCFRVLFDGLSPAIKDASNKRRPATSWQIQAAVRWGGNVVAQRLSHPQILDDDSIRYIAFLLRILLDFPVTDRSVAFAAGKREPHVDVDDAVVTVSRPQGLYYYYTCTRTSVEMQQQCFSVSVLYFVSHQRARTAATEPNAQSSGITAACCKQRSILIYYLLCYSTYCTSSYTP